MAYTIISQNNTTTTLQDENGNIIYVPGRVTLATSTDYTITEVNNNTATLSDGSGNVIRDVPCVVVLAGDGGGGGSGLPSQTGNAGKFLTTDGTDASWSDITKVNTTVTLTAADWSSNTQTVSVTGMTATGVVMVSPAPADQSAYTSAGVLCTAQAAGTLTFTCDTVPAGDLSVNVVML